MNKDEYKAKCQWLSEFYAEAAKTGREMLFNDKKDGWIHGSGCGPCVFSSQSDWILASESRFSKNIIQEITKPD